VGVSVSGGAWCFSRLGSMISTSASLVLLVLSLVGGLYVLIRSGMGAVPPSTRRLLAVLEAHPERLQRVRVQLGRLSRLLEHGVIESNMVGCVRTDWPRLRVLANALRVEAEVAGVREAVTLFERLAAMAEVALGSQRER
jgi:hypothetical protein